MNEITNLILNLTYSPTFNVYLVWIIATMYILYYGYYFLSTNNFEDHPKVVNGVSDLMVSVFGENGKHMRIALGATLPLGVAVEVEGLFELS